MPASDLKITALTALTAADPANDVLPIVDVSDNSMAASGTTKKISINNILACSPAATLASATITGDLTVDTSTLKVDSANNRVGIGTASPSYTLDVTSSATTVIRSLASAGNQAYVSVAGNGGAVGASSLDLIQDGSSNAFIYNRANAYLVFGTNNTERLRIDATGNVGIGVTPSAWATYKAIQIGSGGGGFLYGYATSEVGIGNSCYYNAGWKYLTNTDKPCWFSSAAGAFYWNTANTGTAGNAITWTQAMTLDASGILAIGTVVLGFTSSKSTYFSPVAGYWIGNHTTGTPSGDRYWGFGYGVNEVGSITQNGTTGVLYNITSDYRLKEQIQPLVGGLARVNALKPSVYKWKSDGSNGEGFLAHELAEVVPFAVSGEKDAVNEDGSIKSQGIDMSRVVPILVAAIQELAAEVNALKNA